MGAGRAGVLGTAGKGVGLHAADRYGAAEVVNQFDEHSLIGNWIPRGRVGLTPGVGGYLKSIWCDIIPPGLNHEARVR